MNFQQEKVITLVKKRSCVRIQYGGYSSDGEGKMAKSAVWRFEGKHVQDR